MHHHCQPTPSTVYGLLHDNPLCADRQPSVCWPACCINDNQSVSEQVCVSPLMDELLATSAVAYYLQETVFDMWFPITVTFMNELPEVNRNP